MVKYFVVVIQNMCNFRQNIILANEQDISVQRRMALSSGPVAGEVAQKKEKEKIPPHLCSLEFHPLCAFSEAKVGWILLS